MDWHGLARTGTDCGRFWFSRSFGTLVVLLERSVVLLELLVVLLELVFLLLEFLAYRLMPPTPNVFSF